MKPIEKKLDQLIQEIACREVCEICPAEATVGHHFIGRSERSIRWDMDNIVPLCGKCHFQIHNTNTKILKGRILLNRGPEWERRLKSKIKSGVYIDLKKLYQDLIEKYDM